MSNRKRPGSWQEEVAKGFSRFFSRAPSQEKEEEGEKTRKDSGDEQERGDRGLSRRFSRGSSQERRESSESPHAEEQEKGQSVPGLFSRRISQDNKGDTEQTDRDDQEKNKVFSRVFTRASSQEKEEDNDMSQTKGATPESDSQENKSTHLMTDSNENVASVEQIKHEPYLIQNAQDTPRTEEEMDLGLSEDVKVHDSEKQSKENFLHFIGNLFHLSPKSSQTNPKAAARNQELRKDNEDAFVKFNVHKEPLHVERSLDNCNGVSHTTEDNEAHAEQTFESSSPVVPPSSTKTSFGIAEIPSVLIEAEGNTETASSNVETPSSNNESLEGTEQIHDESPTMLPKNTSSSCLEAPSITYGTYRGSRRIRKLLKRRPDINSPIPEKEENSERETPDIGNNTDCNAPNQRDGLKQASVLPKNGDNETSSQTIHVAIHSEESSNNIKDQQPDTEKSQLERLQPNSKRIPTITDDLESHEGVLTVTDNLTVNVKDFPNCTEDEQATLEGKDSILPDEDTVLPEERMAPETDYEMSIRDMEEPRPGATEPVKPAMDFLPHTKAALDFQPDVEEYQTNEGDLQYFEDQHLHSKESVKTSNVSWQPTEKESPMSVDELRPNISPLDVELSTENIGDFQIPDVGLKYAEEELEEEELEEEELDKSSLIRGDVLLKASGDSATTNKMQPNLNMISHNTKDLESYTKESLNTSEVQHHRVHETSMTTEGFQNSIEENSNYLDYSHPVLDSNLFTSKSASAQSNENENGNFVETQEQMQPDSDIEYNESESTPNTEAHNDDQSGLYRENSSSSLVNSTPDDLQSHEIQTLPSAFSEDTKRSVNAFPDADYAPMPPSNFTEVICSSPVTTDLPSDVNIIDNYNSIDFSSSSTIIDSNSPVKQTTPALSFDNSVDFPSSAHTTSSQSPLSPAGSISLRADSPLPSSEGIDSGVVSSQAYTPEENTIVNISPSELYNNVAFTNSQKHNITPFIEPEKDIPENSVSTPTHFGSTNKLPILPTLSEENVSGMKDGARTNDSPSTNNDVTLTQKYLDNNETMDNDMSPFYKKHNHSSNGKPGDFYVAKVCVKSVDVKEVKMTPYIVKTEVIAMSKVVSPRFIPEIVSLPNISSPPPDRDSENLKNNNFPPHVEPEKDSVTNIKVSQTKPRDSSDSSQDFQQDGDANVRWTCETNRNHKADDEEASLSSEIGREQAVNLPYPKSKDPCISTASEIANKCIDSVKQHVIPDAQPNDPNISDGINLYGNLNDVTVAFLNGKNDETPDKPNVVNHIGSRELHNANYIPSGEINANEFLPDETPLKSTVTNQKNDLEFISSNVNFDQGYLNDETVTRRLHKNVSKVSEGIEETKTLLQPAYNSQGTDEDDTDLTPDVQSDFLLRITSQDVVQMMSDFIENQRLSPSETSPDSNDDSSFSVQNGYYAEIGENDEETADGENVSEEDLDTDSQMSKQGRRVPFYPFSLSPIYEDDSSSEDVLSNRASPRCIDGDDENTNDHTSILSLLQSVSDRLKQESNSSLHNEKTELNQSTNETENTTSKSFKGAATFNDEDENSTDSTKCSQISSKHGLFINKSIIDNRPALGLGRKSFLLQGNSQVNTHGPKSSGEPTPLPGSEYKSHGVEGKDPTLTESGSTRELSNSTPLKPPSISPLQNVTVQTSDFGPKSHLSPKSVYYQYFSDVNDYSERTDNEKSHGQRKMDNSQEYGPQKADSLIRNLSNSDLIKPNPRPGKVVISDIIEHEMKLELYSDILDATSLIFPNGVNIRVIRGCWILYEKADFQGQAHVLEEGEAVLQQLWGPPGMKSTPEQVIIGSIKRVTKDYVPEVVLSRLYGTSGAPICLRTEIPSLKKHLDSIPRSLEVISGVWLAYTNSQFSGTVSVLEEGSVLPSVLESGIQSLRPLKLGGLKVQLPSQPKIILYQKPCFEGWSRELTDHVYSINTMSSEGDGIGSIRVIGGIWVGYEKERYKGMQYLLEEGEYEDWNAWGGISDTLQSLRYLHADFLETSVTLFESEAEDGKSMDLFNQAVPDLESSGYSSETQCIHVKKGIWVAYQQKYYCGEQYILEKGRYKSCVDWGGRTSTIMSIRPVMLEPLGKEEPKHLMTSFSGENFQGQCENYVKETFEFPDFAPRSFKVLRGCWLLCYQAETCENLCVLEEGNFPDLVTCGCPAAVIKYIKPIDYVFAEPSISLFALDLCEGRELHFEEPVTSVLSKDLNFYTQSVWIRKGLWIVFEGANFLGRQLLLDAGQILNWTEFSGWKAIGSLRPLKQTPVYFRIKNRHNDKYLTVTGTLTDTRATFVCVSARNGQKTQIWYFCRGLLKSKANGSCVDVIGGKNLPGSKVSLWAEHGKSRQKWRINNDGTITSYISDDLVLDLKGGNYYDQNYIVVNRTQKDVVTQKWDIEIL